MVKKFYMGESKPGSIEDSILGVWKNAAENNMSGEHSYEVGTDRYRKHTQEITPGQQVEESVELEEGKMSQLHQMIKDKKTAEQIAKEMKLDVKTVKSLMSNYNMENVKESISLRDTVINMWAEASSAVNPNDREELDKEVDGKGGAETAKKMKRASEPKPMVATEGLEDSPNKANSQHLCAKNVVHEEWGEGNTVPTMHADPDDEGNIAWYDVMFEHGVEKGILINELKVTRSETHEGHKKSDKEKEMLKAKHDKEMSETNKNDKSDDGEGMDAVQPKAVKKKFDDRKDKDIDNDGDTDDSDEFLHKKRKAISKAMKKEEVELDEAKSEKDEGNAFSKALMAAKEKGEKTFVVSGKTYEVQEELSLENAQQFKVASMKEALAKVWGLDEKHSPEQQAAIAISKKEKSKKENAKTDTGGKMAEIDIDPDLKEKK